jgi:hypothetical protein
MNQHPRRQNFAGDDEFGPVFQFIRRKRRELRERGSPESGDAGK